MLRCLVPVGRYAERYLEVGRYLCATVCPSAPLRFTLGLARPNQKKNTLLTYIVLSHTAHPPLAPTLPVEPFLRASPKPRPSITNPRQSKSTFDWSKVEFRTRPLSRLAVCLGSIQVSVLISRHHRRLALCSRQPIIDLAERVASPSAPLSCPPQKSVLSLWFAFFPNSQSPLDLDESSAVVLVVVIGATIVNQIPPLPEPTARRQPRVAHCV